jgi:hypothetical protein
VQKYRIKNFVNCPIPGSSTPAIYLNLSFPEPDYYKLNGKGIAIINEKIDGDASLVVEGSRCALDLKTCQKSTPFKFGELCKKIADEKAFYYSALKDVSPPLRCPIKAGNYTVPESTLDLSMFSKFSLDGYIYVMRFKIIVNGANNVKKTLMCYSVEVEVSKVRVRN